MPFELWQGLLIPFAGTTLGAACVFFMRNNLSELVQRALTGFAAGVMVAASIWSLLLPAMEQASDMVQWSFFPAVAGFWLGILFLLGLDRLIPHLHRGSSEAEGVKSSLGKTTMLTLAGALHNIPEGMAVGAVYAGWLYGDSGITLAGALALSLGIAIQNFPERDYIHAPESGGALQTPLLPVWDAVRCSGAGRRHSDHPAGWYFSSGAALCPELCRRSDDLCGSGRIDPGDVSRKALQCGNHSVCSWSHPYDDAGCGAGCLSAMIPNRIFPAWKTSK